MDAPKRLYHSVYKTKMNIQGEDEVSKAVLHRIFRLRVESRELRKDEGTHDLPDGLGDIRTVDGDWQKVDNAPLVTGDVKVLHGSDATTQGDMIISA